MRVYVRSSLLALTALGLVTVAGLQAQTPPARQSAAPATGKAAATAPARPSNPTRVLATVNREPITKADFLDLIMRYQIPPGNEQQVYTDGIETLINTRLINQFLARQQLQVSESKLDADIEQLKKDLKEDGRDLATALIESGKTIDDVKKELAARQRWIEYVKEKGTDDELKKFVASNKDLFNGTQVRASHIMLKLDPKGAPADEEKVKQRLLQIKHDIESNKYTFAEAANKFTEDPTHTEGDGGDIGYFGKNTGIIEEFADAAFAMKKGQISDPIRTIHGYHLIQVTDRKEGRALDFESKKNFALQMYAMNLQKNILTAARKEAKVEIKPMPPDLFPPAPAPAVVPAPSAGSPTIPKDATPKR